MGRLLLILLAIGAVALVLRRIARRERRGELTGSREKTEPSFEKTLRCTRCGAYLPARLTQTSAEGVICRDRCETRDADHDRP